MLDTNIFDRLERDEEAVSELENRRDLRPVISEIQLAQLAGIADAGRRERYLSLAGRLCAKMSVPATGAAGNACPPADRHEPDRMIAAATAARCDILVSDDKGLLEYSKRVGVRAMDWDSFASGILFSNR
jgi:predicted nucleic acid-binding protein